MAAVTRPTANRVPSQEAACCAKNFQFTPMMPSAKPTPTMAPTMHWLLLVGRPYWEHTMMTMAVASSAEKPRVGDSLAIMVPMARVTL
jgi:hypothetical protein